MPFWRMGDGGKSDWMDSDGSRWNDIRPPHPCLYSNPVHCTEVNRKSSALRLWRMLVLGSILLTGPPETCPTSARIVAQRIRHIQ